jgi:hypothetical protein
MIGHHDKFVEKELLLAAILKDGVEEEKSHPVGLEQGAASPRCGRDEICVGPERGVIARRLGHSGPRGLKPHLRGAITAWPRPCPPVLVLLLSEFEAQMSVTRVHQIGSDLCDSESGPTAA